MLGWLEQRPVTRLVYMSCSPTSLRRDLDRLTRHGWHLAGLEAWDMLPGTAHVELLARLEVQ